MPEPEEYATGGILPSLTPEEQDALIRRGNIGSCLQIHPEWVKALGMEEEENA